MPGKRPTVSLKELIEQAMDFVYTDFEKYVKTQAHEHTIANLGQQLGDHSMGPRSLMKPEHLVDITFEGLRCAYGSELRDEGEGVDEEFRHWLKEAKKNCGLVKKAGLPWTLRNSRDAFERRGTFAQVKTT